MTRGHQDHTHHLGQGFISTPSFLICTGNSSKKGICLLTLVPWVNLCSALPGLLSVLPDEQLLLCSDTDCPYVSCLFCDSIPRATQLAQNHILIFFHVKRQHCGIRYLVCALPNVELQNPSPEKV